MEEGDEDLWELLITLSIGKPSTLYTNYMYMYM
jgi:hypothetical protein